MFPGKQDGEKVPRPPKDDELWLICDWQVPVYEKSQYVLDVIV